MSSIFISQIYLLFIRFHIQRHPEKANGKAVFEKYKYLHVFILLVQLDSLFHGHWFKV